MHPNRFPSDRNGPVAKPETGERRKPMSDHTDLPIHPTTGLRALAVLRRGPVWPVLGGSEGGAAGGGEGAGAGAGDGGAGAGGEGGDGQKETETVEFWKGKAREQERRAKENASAADELSQLKDAQKTQAERDADRVKKAEAEVEAIPSKVAEALKAHLVARHQIAAEDAELFLTATEPELLLKQVDRLLGQSDKGKRKHQVPGEGANKKSEGKGELREFARNLFGTNT
jgi:hypothetical protein